MGWFVPQTLGVGYKYVGDSLNGGMALKLMVLLLVLKLFAVTRQLRVGKCGRYFRSELVHRSDAWRKCGHDGAKVVAGHVAAPGAYALVGMGTAFAGIVRAPMTSVVMIFETTRDYAVIVPLMISNLVSLFISSRFQPKPIYEVLAEQDGIHLPTGDDSRTIEGQRRVMRAMRPATEILTCDMTVTTAVENVKGSSIHAWPVSDKPGIVGVVSRATLEKVLSEGGGDGTLEQFTNGTRSSRICMSDQPLSVALDGLGRRIWMRSRWLAGRICISWKVW